jgi:hypothetical protein
VPGGQQARDEEPEPVGVHEVEVGRAGQPRVQVPQLVGRDAQAAVFDLDGEAVGDPLGPDLHPGGRRREQGRVLYQLGQQVDHVVDRGRRDDLLGLRADGDPLVVLGFRHGRADDVDDRHRADPRPGRRRTRQDRQALGVAPHPGGEMVKREQVGERGRAGRLLFQRVDDAQLPQQQRLVPPAQARQDLPEAAAQPGLRRGRRDRRALQAREGGGDGRELGDRRGRQRRARLPRRGAVDSPGHSPGLIAQPGHGPWQLVVGEIADRRGEAGGLPAEPASEDHDEHDDDDGDEEPGSGDHRRLDNRPVSRPAHDPVQGAGEYGTGEGAPRQHQADGGYRQPEGEVGPHRATGATRRPLTGRTWYRHAAAPVTPGTWNPCVSSFFFTSYY